MFLRLLNICKNQFKSEVTRVTCWVGYAQKKMTGTLFDTVGVVYFEGRKNITFNQYLLQNKEIL